MLANVQRSKLTAILIYMLKRLYGGFKTYSFFFLQLSMSELSSDFKQTWIKGPEDGEKNVFDHQAAPTALNSFW